MAESNKTYLRLLYITLILISIIPYNYIGTGAASAILTFFASILLIKSRCNTVLNKKYCYLLAFLFILSCISFAFSLNTMRSLEGLTIYVNALLFYIIFAHYKNSKEIIMDIIVYTAASFLIVFIVYQGIILRKRIDGNFAYANSYALFLLIVCYLNTLRENKTFYELIQVILFLGIIYTSSRNTLFYLSIFIALKLYMEYKTKKSLSVILDFFAALGMYTLFQTFGIGMLILTVVIISIAYIWVKDIPLKKKNYITIIMSVFAIILVIIFKTNFTARVQNISVNNATLQERLVFFEDGVKHIMNNPLGSGINMYRYRQYFDQSAFYDVQYMHNSFLQTAYDIGIVGAAIFTAIFIYGISVIYKSTDKNKVYYLFLYAAIFLHSLLDFDFSFSTIFIIAVMIISFVKSEDQNEFNFSMQIPLNTITMVLGVYVVLCASLNLIGQNFEKDGYFDKAIATYNISSLISIKDSDVYLMEAQTYNEKSIKQNAHEPISLCIQSLRKAENLNPKDTRVMGNLAFMYEKVGNNNEAMKYYDKFISDEKFYYKAYQVYYNFLKKQGKFKKIDELKSTYYKNLKLINPKSRFMNDQMPKTFEKMLTTK